jgi:2-haloalkanoic acid dehalogenase type II
MIEFEEIARQTTTITFDCYGTLIDWNRGLGASLTRLFGSAKGQQDLARLYVQMEAKVEQERFRNYRDVMKETALRMGRQLGVSIDPSQAAQFAEELPGWMPFPDTNETLALLKGQYRLGVLSNIDRDLFAGTCEHFAVNFDFVITAQDAGSYKPAHGHFNKLMASGVDKNSVLHTAQSLHHDGRPCKELGIAFVWINRYNDAKSENADILREFSDLVSFARSIGKAA